MEFDQNRAGKPFSVTLLDIFRAGVAIVVRWHKRRTTRAALNALSDTQLQDIGLTRHDVCRREK
ncbi:DUF1127 domain-containing protein [Pantoea sp. Mb-10]|uniref:DUF1127 domain-containing protein n=1 Tax=unclassified Pantoea TaxID=2630326 RepID=UPI001E2D74FD|nr:MULTISPECIES: DUF1127 domain-containing protein [unclassified Pantoea]MCE0492313.1 DUF1127 domain-containing protein [Pantoea sp. Mb-10]MCE0503655.1 DUF1127 domain-containing protein [Pantoea sp. Pb-8]